MRLAVLTTDTLHHAHFVRALAAAHDLVLTVVETRAPAPPFPVDHPFEQARDAYERATFFDGRDARVAEFTDILAAPSANDRAAVDALAAVRPGMIVVFGAGRLGPEVLALRPEATLNLHGGDPERYRGLDSHLWSIYHRDWDGLVTVLHHVAPRLDTGAIVGSAPIPVRPGMPLAELRARNTETCVQLVTDAIDAAANGGLASRPQRSVGRYYSFMPAVLKDLCRERFETWAGAAS